MPTPPTRYRAIAWRNGLIELTPKRTPAGAIKLFTFTSPRAAAVGSRVLSVNARHTYDGKALLVPGVPEAGDDEAALDALIGWARMIARRLPRHLPARGFVTEVRA